MNEKHWPQKGDRLFTASGNWRDHARLNSQRDNLSLIAVGYKLAANILTEYVITNQKDYDSLVFPSAFLYRHYLELRLKQLIWDGSQVLNNSKNYPTNHRLDDLWHECHPILEQIAPAILSVTQDVVNQTLDAIGDMLTEFAALDRDSMAFRYPTTKRIRYFYPM